MIKVPPEASGKKVAFCTPTITRPFPQYLAALEASVPLVKAAGWDDLCTFVIGCPYISHTRSSMLRRALDAKADVIVFLDHDLSWAPGDLVTLLETEGDVVAGTYRFRMDEEEYMGTLLTQPDGRPIVRADGCVKAHWVPAGFLKVTKAAVQHFMRKYPALLYGEPDNYAVDLFNHGAIEGVWYGEDYAFSKRWHDIGGEIWIVPDLDLVHHDSQNAYPGNFHRYLLSCPGGSEYVPL
jgi:glycosyltransferase involved in cell wall biosynthesis